MQRWPIILTDSNGHEVQGPPMIVVTVAEMDALRARAETAEAEVDAQKTRIHELQELVRDVFGGAVNESCMYNGSEYGDPTYHCCDWSEWAARAAIELGITDFKEPPDERPAQGNHLRLAEAEVARLREALEWYASPRTYRNGVCGEDRPLMDTEPCIHYWRADNGEKARAALEARNENDH